MNQFSPRAFVAPRAGTPGGGVPVTPGVGATIATDKVGDVDVQVIKLGIGGAGAADMLDYGQQPAAKSLPVVLASDQGNINVSLPPGMATEATLALVAKEATTAKDATLATRASEATLGLVSSGVGLLADGPPATDTANSSLIGQLKRLLQRFTTLLAVFPATLATNVGAANASTLRVALAAGSTVGIGAAPATSTVTSVAAAIASTQLLAANAARVGASIYNDSAAEMYLKHGAGASNVSFSVDMLPGSYYEIPYGYTGVIHGIWASATGAARVTEFTP